MFRILQLQVWLAESTHRHCTSVRMDHHELEWRNEWIAYNPDGAPRKPGHHVDIQEKQINPGKG